METDMTTRRGVLAGLAALALPRALWAEAGRPAYLAAAQEPGGGHALHGLSAGGEVVFSVPLPGRGHAAAAHPARAEAVAFARRPGTFALVIGCASGAVLARLTPPAGRQFNGHGAFSADGARLYTSEVVAETSAGRIGVWDTLGYARIGEGASGGIGPHDLRRMADGRLAVANGGIATDPADRTKLNLGTMRPNLTILTADGRIDDRMELGPDLRKNSIRHLALAPDGTIAFAMQWEGDPAEDVPLLGLWPPGRPQHLCPPLERDARTMRGYAASVAFSGDGAKVALTSPKGGRVQVFGADGAALSSHPRADVSGVAPAPEGFLVTDGTGLVAALEAGGLRPLSTGPRAWDNHLIALM
jgi:uncharacterized protein